MEAIDLLSNGKAPGEDKYTSKDPEGEQTAFCHICTVFKIVQCWQDKEIPREMRNARIVTL